MKRKESIVVFYKPIGPKYYHQFIVYTNSAGEEFAARGGPQRGPNQGSSAFFIGGPGGSGASLEGSSSSASDASGNGCSGSIFGSITTLHGQYKIDFLDHPSFKTKNEISQDSKPRKPYHLELITIGKDLSGKWRKITHFMDMVNQGGYTYRVLTQNSNTTVGDALTYAGLPEPQEDDFGEYWSPGVNNDLSYKGPACSDWFDSYPDFSEAEQYASPIIFDLDGDGVKTLSLAATRHFDLDNSGFAEQTAWVSSGDGLLVRDLDGNGKIESGAELFGNHTALGDGTNAANGYAALAQYDDNGDGLIDAEDSIWQQLQVWRDSDAQSGR